MFSAADEPRGQPQKQNAIATSQPMELRRRQWIRISRPIIAPQRLGGLELAAFKQPAKVATKAVLRRWTSVPISMLHAHRRFQSEAASSEIYGKQARYPGPCGNSLDKSRCTGKSIPVLPVTPMTPVLHAITPRDPTCGASAKHSRRLNYGDRSARVNVDVRSDCPHGREIAIESHCAGLSSCSRLGFAGSPAGRSQVLHPILTARHFGISADETTFTDVGAAGPGNATGKRGITR